MYNTVHYITYEQEQLKMMKFAHLNEKNKYGHIASYRHFKMNLNIIVVNNHSLYSFTPQRNIHVHVRFFYFPYATCTALSSHIHRFTLQ